jgi:hypothetical protein
MSRLLDIGVGVTSHDLEVVDNDLYIVSERDRVRQHLKIRLWFFLREWYLDTTAGVPYFEEILVKAPNITRIENILKLVTIETPDVQAITKFDVTFDSARRRFSVDFGVTTTYGNINDTQEIGL